MKMKTKKVGIKKLRVAPGDLVSTHIGVTGILVHVEMRFTGFSRDIHRPFGEYVIFAPQDAKAESDGCVRIITGDLLKDVWTISSIDKCKE